MLFPDFVPGPLGVHKQVVLGYFEFLDTLAHAVSQKGAKKKAQISLEGDLM